MISHKIYHFHGLALGKEKEGIPQQFLNVVDQCVEIPQLGVIRR